jgi:hypothetical protein
LDWGIAQGLEGIAGPGQIVKSKFVSLYRASIQEEGLQFILANQGHGASGAA